jgi:antitoxin component HigA of HigAB toxin-antitoxin module
MNIKPIKTGEDYEAALKEIEAIFGAEPDTSPMIQRLYNRPGIPAEVLVQPYKLATAQSKSSHRQRVAVAT